MAISFSCPHCGHAFQVEDSYAGQTGPCAACGKGITVPGGASAFAASASYDPAPAKGSSVPLILGIVAGGFVVLFMCGGIMVALLLPAIQAAREAARRNMCINNSKQVALALLNYNDVNGRFPIASTSPVAATPGNAASAGYSWIVPLLPYLEQASMFDEINSNSEDLAKGPFEANQNVAATRIPLLVCPSGNNPELSPAASTVYSSVPMPGISNFIATSASHLINTQGPAELANGADQDEFAGNGIMVFPVDKKEDHAGGLGMAVIRDGLTQTTMFCESREAIYAAWIDGQATWGVAAWPENVDIPTTGADGFLGWPDSDVSSMTSLDVARENRDNPSVFYMASSRFGGSLDRACGPSSNHSAGVVIHTFADGHVQSISSDIDRNLYLRLFTRSGGEVAHLDMD